MKIALFPSRQSLPRQFSRRLLTLFAALLLTPVALQNAAAGTTYKIDPVAGSDTNPPGKPWKTFGRLNAVKLTPGDTVLIAPGVQQETLKPSGEGTAKDPVVIKFLPGVHTLGISKVTRKQLFISNSIDSTEPIPIGIMLSQKNRFINCGIHITSTVHEPKPDEPVHENIRILNNTFENGGISVKAVRGLVAKDNQSGNAPVQIDAAPSCYLPPVGGNAGAVREGTLRVMSFGLGAPMKGPPVDDLYGRDAVFVAEAFKRAPSAWSKVETTAVSGLDCTPERLRSELKRLEETAVAADFVIVHASTHGTTENKLLRLDGSKTVIDANVLAASLGRLPCPSLVSIDACQAGGAVHSRLPAKSAWLLGCTETQSTSGQGDDPKVPHGFQVLALCEALRGDADDDRDGVITVGELCAWVPRRATFLALFSCYQDSVVVLPPALAKLPLTRVTPGEKKPLWTMRKVESRNTWGVQDVPELATAAAPADKLTAAIKARAGETKARAGSEGITKPAEKGRGLDGVWVSRRGANKTEQLQHQGHVEIAETEKTFFAAVVDSSGSYLIEAVRDPADPNRLSGRWSKIDSPEPSSRWEGRIVDSRRIDGQAPGGGWDFRRLKSN